jgi:hypothetical protein
MPTVALASTNPDRLARLEAELTPFGLKVTQDLSADDEVTLWDLDTVAEAPAHTGTLVAVMSDVDAERVQAVLGQGAERVLLWDQFLSEIDAFARAISGKV